MSQIDNKSIRYPLNYQKNILLFIAIFVMVGFITACSGTETPQVPEPTLAPTATPTLSPTEIPTATLQPDMGTITIWHSLAEPEIASLVQIIVDFQNLYPDIQFDVLYLPENILLERYQIAVQEGSGPSILLGPARWAPGLANAGLVIDLKDQVSAELISRLNPAGFSSSHYNGFQAGLPYTLEGVVLYRNTDLIPDAPATWDDLVNQSQAAVDGETIGAFLDRGFFFSGANLEGLGGKLMNANGSPAFANEKGLDWIGLLQDYERAGPTDFLTDADIERFKQGQVGFLIESTNNRNLLSESIGSLNLAIDTWPAYGNGALAGYLVPQLIYFNPQTNENTIRLARMFGDYMLSPEAQNQFSAAGLIPAVLDAPVQSPLISQAVLALSGNFAYPLVPEMEIYRTALDNALQSVFNGSATPEEALQNAESAILAALGTEQPTPTTSP